MADNDVNNTQVVTEQTDANTEQVVTAPGEVTESAPQTEENLDKTVPYDRFKEVNDQKKEAEEGRLFAERQLELMQANIQGQQQVQQTQQAGSTYEQAMLDVGITADDLYDGSNMVKVQNRKEQLDNANQQAQQSAMANNQFIASHPDFAQVVGSVNPATGQLMSLTQEATMLIQNKPYLASATFQGAYDAILQERELKQLKSKAAVNTEHLNRTGVDTATQPLGGSAAGGGGAGDTTPAMMTREQVLETERKLANGEI
jgi:hypothetical protein